MDVLTNVPGPEDAHKTGPSACQGAAPLLCVPERGDPEAARRLMIV
jgi:hypothetical protein